MSDEMEKATPPIVVNGYHSNSGSQSSQNEHEPAAGGDREEIYISEFLYYNPNEDIIGDGDNDLYPLVAYPSSSTESDVSEPQPREEQEQQPTAKENNDDRTSTDEAPTKVHRTSSICGLVRSTSAEPPSSGRASLRSKGIRSYSESSVGIRVDSLERKLSRMSIDFEKIKATETIKTELPSSQEHITANDNDGSTKKQRPSPPTVTAKKLIVILDATHAYTKPVPYLADAKKSYTPRTNLKRLSEALAQEHKDSRLQQLVYYASGRGSGDTFGLNSNLYQTVLDAYTYLSDNWSLGDEIYLFGYSHGAYAIRAVAALLTEIGLFNRAGMKDFDTLYDLYFNPKFGKMRETDQYERWRVHCEKFAFSMSREDGVVLQKVSIKFLGCLDTIGWSCFEDDTFSDKIKEKRLWKRGFASPQHLILHEDIEYAFHALALDEERASHTPMLMFRARDSTKPLRQVWFTGSHTNIGGGMLAHDRPHSLTFSRPDPNELSDIVFLFMISECHEFLTFSKKHINKAVADYMSLQTNDTIKEEDYKGHWVSAKIDTPWSGGSNIATRILNATLPVKKHIRVPLRYRPHWFEDEELERYTSSESVHASSKYRRRHFPSYAPLALTGFHNTKTFARFNSNESLPKAGPGEENEPSYRRSRLIEERFYFPDIEKSSAPFYTGQTTLPLTPMTAFEILTVGGDGVLFGFGIVFKDIYRESPPVFQYTIEELNKMQEGWIFKLKPPKKVSKLSMSEREIALRHATPVDTSLRHRNFRIKEQSAYGTQNAPTPVPTRRRGRSRSSIRSTVSAVFKGSENQPPKPSQNAIPSETRRNEHLEDESGTGKGKGKHSRYSRRSRSRSGLPRNKSIKSDTHRKPQNEGPNIDASGHEKGWISPEKAFREQNSQSDIEESTVNDYERRDGGDEKMEPASKNDDIQGTKTATEQSKIDPLTNRLTGYLPPELPEWERRLAEPGVVHPCKFKKQRSKEMNELK